MTEAGPARLVFVCGTRRSGTTLVNHALAQAAGAPTLAEAQPLTHLLQGFAFGSREFERMTRDFFPSRERWHAFRADTARAFVAQAWATAGRPATLVLKNPELSLHLEALLDPFPDARVVACARDPRDQVASEVEVNARREGAGRADVDRLADDYVDYLAPAAGLVVARDARVLLLRYEDFVRGDAALHARVLATCGIDLARFDASAAWDVAPEYLDKLAARPSRSDAYGKPVTKERIGRWREVLTRDEVAIVEDVTQRLMDFLGYPRGA